MKVNEILSNGKITLSFEVFPPKTDAQFESVRQATIDVAALKPSYMSVTYGAGGNTRKNTVAIAKGIQDTTGVTTIAHLTCVGATKENIHNTLDEMKAAGIEILREIHLLIFIMRQNLYPKSKPMAISV